MLTPMLQWLKSICSSKSISKVSCNSFTELIDMDIIARQKFFLSVFESAYNGVHNITPVKIPGRAAGNVTFTNVVKLLAPRPSDASLYVLGTARIASSLARIITGNVKTASVIAEASMHGFEGPPNIGIKNNTKNASPNNPKTMLGTP